jgi:hypothetical protein
MLRRESKEEFWSSLVIAVVLSIPVIVETLKWYWILIIWIPALNFFITIATISPQKKTYNLIMPSKISIKNGTIESESDKFYYSRSILQIKKIVDLGDGTIFISKIFKEIRALYAKKI